MRLRFLIVEAIPDETRRLILLATLTAMVFISSSPGVKAGGPPTSANEATATLTGLVKFVGTAPRATPIKMAADPSCAQQHPTLVLSQEIATDAQGGLQNVIVFVANGLTQHTFQPPTQPVVFAQKGCLYQPHVLAMQANQRLEVVNDDPTAHNIHPMPAKNREWNKSEPPGTKAEEAFPREEIAIPVKCDIHPWMRGYVAVFKHPYFAVTGKAGSFNLSGLPPGTYTIEAWHEKLGTSTQTVTLRANETKALDFVFKSQPGS